METRPRLKLQLTLTDKIIETTGWLLLLVIWYLTTVSYENLPDRIPVHFNIKGEANRYGSKSNLFHLPVITTFMYIGLTILNQFPHIFNYPTPITTDNALQQYTFATRLIRYLKLFIVVVFGIILCVVIRMAG